MKKPIKINKEMIKKILSNKKMVTVLGIMCLAVGILLSLVATKLANTGYENASAITQGWSQLFIIIFVLFFIYAMLALDKELINKFSKKKKDKEEIKQQIENCKHERFDNILGKCVCMDCGLQWNDETLSEKEIKQIVEVKA